MKAFLARQWPLAPVIAAAAGAVWLRSWPLVAVLGIAVLGALAWERRCAGAMRRGGLDALTANARRPGGAAEQEARAGAGMPAGHPEKLTASLYPGCEAQLEEMAAQTWPGREYETEIEYFGRGETQ